MSTGDWIREHRKRRCMNQTELGELVGVHQHTISHYENGDAYQLDVLLKIIEVLGGELAIKEREDFIYEGDYV